MVNKSFCAVANLRAPSTLKWRLNRLLPMETSMTKIYSGDKVVRDAATENHGKVHLGDYAPAFVRAGDKVVRDAATENQGKVHLGDYAPAFRR